MTPAEVTWLSNHLGHDVSTHKTNYRLHAPAIEITKVGKILMAIDSNDAGGFAGKRLNKLLTKCKYIYMYICVCVVILNTEI